MQLFSNLIMKAMKFDSIVMAVVHMITLIQLHLLMMVILLQE